MSSSKKKLLISAEAKRDLANIIQSVGEYTGSELSMAKLAHEFKEKFEFITLLPKAAKQSNDGTRQTFCRRYRIIYREFGDYVQILTVIHCLRKYP
ncbi:type II toxin-antitoxin system RelE/ParE family toxin [Pasteurella testudinis]|uniref:type II toxin-antitoxin system RelE/ParE family toxin n=1 Tax=Pasteurella testudinis TaxID=761 RepID=UPI00405A0FE4